MTDEDFDALLNNKDAEMDELLASSPRTTISDRAGLERAQTTAQTTTQKPLAAAEPSETIVTIGGTEIPLKHMVLVLLTVQNAGKPKLIGKRSSFITGCRCEYSPHLLNCAVGHHRMTALALPTP